MTNHLARRALCGMALLAAALLANRAAAREPVKEFLDGLRRAELYDLAAEYLQGLASNPNIAEEVKQTIPYELGKTLVEQSRAVKDPAARIKVLDQAAQQFQAFVAATPNHELVPTSQSELGRVLVERGLALVETARRPANAGRKDALIEEARGVFLQAQSLFDAAEKRISDEWEAIKIKAFNREDEKEVTLRRNALDALRLARVNAATVAYESSKTFEPGTPEHKQALEAAAERFRDLREKYRQYAIGLYAAMFQGRAYQDMGDTKRAVTTYQYVLEFPDDPAFHDIKTQCLSLALQCWTLDSEKQYEVAAQKGEEWLQKARPDDERSTAGFGIRYFTAIALDKQLDAAKAAGMPEDSGKRKTLLEHATFLTKYRGDYQRPAKTLIAKYRKVDTSLQPQTFAEARDAAKAALDAMAGHESFITVAQAKQDAAMLAEVAEREKAIEAAKEEARRMYELSLSLRDEETTLDDVNAVRYFLAYLYYQENRYFDAAVLGEFLARRYPESAGAKSSAHIALNAYRMTYSKSPAEERQFEMDRMAGIAQYITEKWPGEAEADMAWMILAEVAIERQDLAKAAEYLANIAPESPRRGEADLKSGSALWAQYLSAMKLPEQERPAPEELAALSQRAETTLAEGVARMRQAIVDPSQVTYTLLASELSLAQIYVESGQAAKALEVLERPDSGCLALVRAKAEVANRGNFYEETYKASLRAFVGAQRLTEAEQTMTELEALVGDRQDSAVRLTRIYISLGKQLEEQVDRLRSENKTAELQAVLDGFTRFLAVISAREQGNTFSSLNWVAETFFRLGSGLDTDDALTPEARNYYEQAAQTYETMLTRSKAEPDWAPQGAQTAMGLNVRIARCQRELGDYKKSLDRLAEILKQNPRILDAQVEAAYTYQEWGRVKPAYYNNAILGARKDPQSGELLFFGWQKLSAMLARNAQQRSLYFECAHNVAECRFRLGASQQGADRTRNFDLAMQLIVQIYKLNPEMGGDESMRKFDRLLRNIQTAAGKKSTGLQGLPKRQAPAATAAAGGGQ